MTLRVHQGASEVEFLLIKEPFRTGKGSSFHYLAAKTSLDARSFCLLKDDWMMRGNLGRFKKQGVRLNSRAVFRKLTDSEISAGLKTTKSTGFPSVKEKSKRQVSDRVILK